MQREIFKEISFFLVAATSDDEVAITPLQGNIREICLLSLVDGEAAFILIHGHS